MLSLLSLRVTEEEEMIMMKISLIILATRILLN